MIDDPVLAALVERLLPLTRRFTEAGYRVYLVGGIVRDLMLDPSPQSDDIDLTTDALPDTIRRLLAPVATAMWTQGERFGTIGARVGQQAIEVTTHRADRYEPTSRKPQVAFGTDLTVDLSRRDFTVNAMARELPSGRLIDPFGGRADLAARWLRTPLDPVVSFSDDPLRMLRAARFVARLGLSADPKLVSAAAGMADRLSIVSAERIHDELERLLRVVDPAPGLSMLVSTGLIEHVLAESARLGATNDARFGGRTRLDVAEQAVAGTGDVVARRALLFWPVAEEAGLPGVEAALGRLRYSAEDRRSTARVAVGVVAALASSEHPRVALRRLVVELAPPPAPLSEALRGLVALCTDRPGADRLRSLAAEAAQLADPEARRRLEPPLDGWSIMAHLGCGPGPVIGAAAAWLRQRIIERGPLDQLQARAELDRWWAARSGGVSVEGQDRSLP